MISLPDGIVGEAFACSSAFTHARRIHFAAVALLSYEAAQRLQDRQELARRYQNLARDLPRLRAAVTQRLANRRRRPSVDRLTDAVAAATCNLP